MRTWLLLLVLACVPPGSSRSLTLPLHYFDGGKTGGSGGRRLLRNSTLPLHGAVKDYGYFYASLYLGTPPKKFAVIVDTGSTMTYVPCATCGAACGPNHQDAAFDPRLSLTAQLISCNSDKCRCGAPQCACSDKQQCVYTRSYAEQSSSSGVLLEDVLSLHDGGAGAPVIFGCEMRETGEIFKQRADGLLGLGNSEASVVNQLVAAGEIDDTFSLCFGTVEGDGALVLGDVPAAAAAAVSMQYTPLVASPTHPFYYNVRLASISVGGDHLALPPGLFDEGYGTVLDSGTTFTYVPTPAFKAFAGAVEASALAAGLSRVRGPDLQYDDVCFGGAPEHTDTASLGRAFPAMALHFAQDVVLTLGPLNYLFVHTFNSGKYCLGVFDNGRAGTLLGGITFRNVLVQYDRQHRRVGFGAAACKQLGEAHRPPCSAFSADGNELAAIVAVADGDCQPEAVRPQGEEEEDYDASEHEVIMPSAGAGKTPAAVDVQAAQPPPPPQLPSSQQGGTPQVIPQESKGTVSTSDENTSLRGAAVGGARSKGPASSTSGGSDGGFQDEEEVVVGPTRGMPGGSDGFSAAGSGAGSSQVGSGSSAAQAVHDSRGQQHRQGLTPVSLALMVAVLLVLTAACVAALVRLCRGEGACLGAQLCGRYGMLQREDPEAGSAGGATVSLVQGAGKAAGSVAGAQLPDVPAKGGWSGAMGALAKQPSAAPMVAAIAMTELSSKAPGAAGEKRVLGITSPQKLQRTNSAAAAAAAMAEELAAMRAESLTPRAAAAGAAARAIGVQQGTSPLGRAGMGPASLGPSTVRTPGTPTRMQQGA